MKTVQKRDSVGLFGKNEMGDIDQVKQMLDKLADQEKKVRFLQQSLLRERYAKESIQSDLEHVLCQLNSLQQVQDLAKKIDVTYL
jgi:predicted component of type VI protein secretion system